MSPSYQLPDLLSLCRPFELRTNDHCRPASVASESWLYGLKTDKFDDVLTDQERIFMRPAKYGLLAALCVPGCGQTQLRFFSSFLSLLNIADGRMKRARSLTESGWSDDFDLDGVNSLKGHALFQYLLPELRRFASSASSGWKARFANSVYSYRSAQLQVITNRLNDVIPDHETFLPLRRHISGLYLMLDLIELTENMDFHDSLDVEVVQNVEKLKQVTANILCFSLDVIAFNNDQVQGNRHNLVAITMTHSGLSLQGAVNSAGAQIKEMFDTFFETEIFLFNPSTPQTNYSGGSLSSYWKWITSMGSTTPETLVARPNTGHGGDLIHDGDLPSYIQSLKDCIVGTINWAYETEIYFGRKGEEIRTFGWVFLLNPIVDGDEHP